MEKKDLFVLSAQCTMFFNPMVSIDKNKKIQLLSEISQKCGSLDGEPTLLPIPEDAPPDIPRVQLNSKDNSFTYGISLQRSDFAFFEIAEPKKKFSDIKKDLFNYEKEILTIYKQNNWNIARLSLVIKYSANLDSKVSDFISSKFLLNSTKYDSIELSLLKRDVVSECNINRWLRMKSPLKQENILEIMIDLNTFAEKKLDLTVDKMIDFYNNLTPYIEKEIKETFGEVFSA